MEPWAAFVLGIGSGLTYLLFATVVVKLKIDDPLDTVGSEKFDFNLQNEFNYF
jgi:ammonia channel protein AmtB